MVVVLLAVGAAGLVVDAGAGHDGGSAGAGSGAGLVADAGAGHDGGSAGAGWDANVGVAAGAGHDGGNAGAGFVPVGVQVWLVLLVLAVMVVVGEPAANLRRCF